MMSAEPQEITQEEYKKPRIAIIGVGVSSGHIAMLRKVADVVVFDSVAEMQEQQDIPQMEILAIDEFAELDAPDPTERYTEPRRGGKGKGRGAASWNKRNRGY